MVRTRYGTPEGGGRATEAPAPEPPTPGPPGPDRAGADAGADGHGTDVPATDADPDPAATRAHPYDLASEPGPQRQRRAALPPVVPRQKLRSRVLPRSVLGIASLILALAVGAGFSGVVLYSYYQYKLNQTNSRVNTLVTGYKKQFAKAEADLGAAVAAAQANIQSQMQAFQQLQGTPATLANMIKQLSPSLFFVHTLDASGQPAVGSAFVISSNSSQSLLITSYTTVAAATRSPGPPVYVRKDDKDLTVQVQAWDPKYDLALLLLRQGNLPAVVAAPSAPAPEPGAKLYAVSGLGSAGASIDPATVVDVSSAGVALDAGLGNAFQGAPVVNQAGQVVAVASRTYSPLGFTTTGIWYAPYVEAACARVLSCPGGTLAGSH